MKGAPGGNGHFLGLPRLGTLLSPCPLRRPVGRCTRRPGCLVLEWGLGPSVGRKLPAKAAEDFLPGGDNAGKGDRRADCAGSPGWGGRRARTLALPHPQDSHGLCFPRTRPHIPGARNRLRPSLSLASGSQGSLRPTLGSTGPFHQAHCSLPALRPSPLSLQLPTPSARLHLCPGPSSYTQLPCPEGAATDPPHSRSQGSPWRSPSGVGVTGQVHLSLTWAELRSGSLKWASGGQGTESWVTPARGVCWEGSRKRGQGLGRGPFSRPAAPRPG